jgi:hypothetical protein
MIGKILNSIFGCRHKSITRPTTPEHKAGTQPGDTYVACLECGKRFKYDLIAMKIGKLLAANALDNGRFQI